jgi:hypothetical protein
MMPMFWRALFVTALLVLAPGRTSAQLPADYRTQGWPNGRYWEFMQTQLSNVHFLNGLESGVGLAVAVSGAPRDVREGLLIVGFQMADIVNEIDRFYSERADMRVPVAHAYSYVVRKMKGEGARALEDYASDLRRQFQNNMEQPR